MAMALPSDAASCSTAGTSKAASVPHPYARIYAKKDAKRRRIWNHVLEKSVFSPLQLSTVGAQDRRPIYVASLEAHIDRLHAQLKALACYPVRDDQLAPYIGLHSKVAKSMVSSLQHDISQTNLKLLELERANAKLRESLGLPPKAPPLLVPSPPPRPHVPCTFPDLSAHTGHSNHPISEPVPSYSQASTPASHFYSSANPNSDATANGNTAPIELPTLPMPEPSSLSFYYSSQPSQPSLSASSTSSSSSPTDTCSSSGASAYAAPSPIYSTPMSPSSLADALSPVSPIHSTHSAAPSPAYCPLTITTQHNSPVDTSADFSMLSQPYYPPPPAPSIHQPQVQPPVYDDADAYRHEQHLMLAYPAVYLDPQPQSPYGVAYVDVQQPRHLLGEQQPQTHGQHHVQQEQGEWKQGEWKQVQQRDEEEQRVHTIRVPHPRFHPYHRSQEQLPQQEHPSQQYGSDLPPSYPSHASYPSFATQSLSYYSQEQGQGQEQQPQPELYTFPESVYPSPVSPSWTDSSDAYTPSHQTYMGYHMHVQPGSGMHTHTAHTHGHGQGHGHGQYHYESVQSVSLQAF